MFHSSNLHIFTYVLTLYAFTFLSNYEPQLNGIIPSWLKRNRYPKIVLRVQFYYLYWKGSPPQNPELWHTLKLSTFSGILLSIYIAFATTIRNKLLLVATVAAEAAKDISVHPLFFHRKSPDYSLYIAHPRFPTKFIPHAHTSYICILLRKHFMEDWARLKVVRCAWANYLLINLHAVGPKKKKKS